MGRGEEEGQGEGEEEEEEEEKKKNGKEDEKEKDEDEDEEGGTGGVESQRFLRSSSHNMPRLSLQLFIAVSLRALHTVTFN